MDEFDAVDGPLQAAFLRANAAATGGDAAEEQAFVASYLNSREKRQVDAPDPGREAQRLARLRELVRNGDWALNSVPALVR